ncbi:MAG TPA: ROK family protein, partial [Acidimicrobiales bacterium]|nr:ROK family protein [Acidimicrobiales bacterium]
MSSGDQSKESGAGSSGEKDPAAAGAAAAAAPPAGTVGADVGIGDDQMAGAMPPERPYTLAIDIGGTGLKASVLDASGSMVADRVRVATTYPLPPTGDGGMVPALAKLVASLPEAERISAGFPGMVRKGHILSAPHFVTKSGPGSANDPKLVKAWTRFDLAGALSEAIGKPAKVANDADVQGL